MTASNSNTASTYLLGSGLLVVATIGALLLANLPPSTAYAAVWHLPVGPLSVEHWINDGLMAIFFLLIGLELERALYVGHLSQPRKALQPIVAAIGGMAFPALIHYALNHGTSTQPGLRHSDGNGYCFCPGRTDAVAKPHSSRTESIRHRLCRHRRPRCHHRDCHCSIQPRFQPRISSALSRSGLSS